MRKLLFSLILVLVVAGGIANNTKYIHAASKEAYCYNCGNVFVVTNTGDIECFSELAEYHNCPNCGTNVEVVFDPDPVNGKHNYLTNLNEATCVNDGFLSKQCVDCGHTDTQVIKAKGHSWQTITAADSKEATCTTNGVQYERCASCSEIRTSVINATGHNYQEIGNTTTCTANGTKTYKCSKCGDTKTETVGAYGHNYSEKVIRKATCTETGLTRKTCSRCNEVQDTKVKALGHKYSDWKVKSEPTCEEKGLETRICSRCKDEETRDIDALGHKSTEMTLKKEATCTEDGYRSSECEVCGKEFKEVIPATGHDFPELEVTAEPSLGKEGLKEATCKHCEEVKSEVIPALTVGEFVDLHTGAVVGGAAGAAGVAGAGIYLALAKKKAAETAASAAASATATAGLGVGGKIAAANTAKKVLEGLETKVIDVVASESDGAKELIDTFKKQPMLEVNYDGLEGITDKVAENGPDMVIFEVNEDSDLVKITDWIAELDDDEMRYAAIGPKEVMKRNADTLKTMKEEKKLVSYTNYEKIGGVIADIILPLYKPELDVENSLNGAGIVMSALGLDWAAGIIDMLAAGNDIREIIADGDPEAEDKLTILADVCSIFGLDVGDTFESIASYIENLKHAGKKTKENFGAEDPDKKTFEDLNEEPEIESDENTEE